MKAKKKGNATITIKGKGNYTGKKLKAKNNYKVEFFTTDGTKVSKKDKFEAGTKLIAKITGTGNYEGEIVKEYMVK